jgi:hypothetical protein
MLTNNFLAEFKRATEAKWRELPIDPALYGFQFQPGTLWNPGLSNQQIAAYQHSLDVRFPNDFHAFLQAMNGTNLPTLNIYGFSGYPPRQSVGVYSYPKDLEVVQSLIQGANLDRDALATSLADEGFDLSSGDGLVPIYAHRYLVCTADLNRSMVLSIMDADDAIVYGNSLQHYLETQFLR